MAHFAVLIFISALIGIFTAEGALTMPSSSLGRAGKCDFAWHSHGSHCYRIFYNKATWFEAADRCAKFGGLLTTVEDAVEDGFLGGLLTGPGLILPHWIGVLRKNMEMPAVWVDGVKRNFSRWRTGDADYMKADTTCVRAVASSTSSTEWLAEDCLKEYPYLCKKPIN
uniref:C-type lectin domain-containing protein n=1 Tax=Steinernema glaseri TaxID=37863 RepID=A0A1I7Y6Z4_9BILA